MVKNIRNYLKGAGSVLVIMPTHRVSCVGHGIRRGTEADALGADWQRVGDDMRAAVRRVAVEGGKRGQSQ